MQILYRSIKVVLEDRFLYMLSKYFVCHKVASCFRRKEQFPRLKNHPYDTCILQSQVCVLDKHKDGNGTEHGQNFRSREKRDLENL